MNAVNVKTKDISPGVEVKHCFRDINYKFGLEEGNENYIKKELGVDGC